MEPCLTLKPRLVPKFFFLVRQREQVQKLLNKPRISQVHLEEFGSFIWMEIDGKKTLISISEEVHKEFGEKAEPLLPRLVQYFRILENNSFITRCGK